MTRAEFLSAADQCNRVCAWFNLGASERHLLNMVLVHVDRDDLLRKFAERPEITSVRAEILDGQILCVGWDGGGTEFGPAGEKNGVQFA